MRKWLFSKTDNSPLVIFRVIFGFLITCESWGAIATGWVRKVLIEPKFTFNFIGFDFLQPLPGDGMYAYFGIMGLCGLFIMLGYRYLIAMVSFSILWASVYLMQKSAYNNHYYLLMLISFIMCCLPANKDLSLDVKFGITQKQQFMPKWVYALIVGQLFIVYTYAAVAKIYPDWLDATVARNMMISKKDYPIIGGFLQQNWVHFVIAYFGILFDLLVIPALIYKPTRKFFFGLSVFFHLYNSIFLGIGIFPYLALGCCVFFFPSKQVRRFFYPKEDKQIINYNFKFQVTPWKTRLVGIWLLVQFLLPLRHWVIPGDVLWTEEGHRLSWRMMLRSKRGVNIFYIQDPITCVKKRIRLNDFLTKKQIYAMGGKPDMIWQFAQYLNKYYCLLYTSPSPRDA